MTKKMKNVFPYGAKHLQVSEKKKDQNIKEILAPSTVNLNDGENVNNETTEWDFGCNPCNKRCVYCQLLSKTEADHFKSVQTGQSFKIRQSINCQSKDIIYLINCVKCNLLPKLMKEYLTIFHILSNEKKTCSIVEHFIDHHWEEWKESYKKIICFKLLESVNLPTSHQIQN